MLPSRGFSSPQPAIALTHCISGPRQIPLTRWTTSRQFSQIRRPGQSREQWSSRSSALRGNMSSNLPRISSNVRGPAALGGVFSQSGASRSWSLWSVWPNKQKVDTTETKSSETTTTSSSVDSPPETSLNTDATAASATTAPASAPAEVPLSAPGAGLPSPLDVSSSFSPESLADLESTSVLDIPEQIGYLHMMGLDFGWGPTAICSWALEHVHIWTGMPWWASIVSLALIGRLSITGLTLKSSKMSAIMMRMKHDPEFRKLQEDMVSANDMMEQARLQQRMKAITRKAGFKWRSMLAPHLIMAPLGYGMFRLIRAMAALPIPGLETGGIAWFTDLTIADPLYILPLTTCALTYTTVKLTQITGQSQAPEGAMALLPMALPVVVFLVAAWFPAGLNLYFLFFQLAGVLQQSLLLMPGIRKKWGLPPLTMRSITPSKISSTWKAPTPRRGIRGMLDGVSKDVGNTLSTYTGRGVARKTKEQAEAYEERRAAEEKQKQQRRIREQLDRRDRRVEERNDGMGL